MRAAQPCVKPTPTPVLKITALRLQDKLVQIPTYHVVAGKVMAADAAKLTNAETVAMLPITIKAEMSKVMINDATVVLADITASNGVIHVIDAVLLPSSYIVDTAVADGRFTTLIAVLQAAGLVNTLNGDEPFTVLLPPTTLSPSCLRALSKACSSPRASTS